MSSRREPPEVRENQILSDQEAPLALRRAPYDSNILPCYPFLAHIIGIMPERAQSR